MRSKAKIAAFTAFILMTALLLTACGGPSPIGIDNTYGRTVGLIILGTDETTTEAVDAWKTLAATKAWDIQEFKSEAKMEPVMAALTKLYTELFKKDASGQNGQNASMVVVAGGSNELSNQIVKYVNDTNYKNNTEEKGSKVSLVAFFIGTTPDDPAAGSLQSDFKDKAKLKDLTIDAAPHGVVTTEGVTVGQLPGDLCFQQIVYAFSPNVTFKRDGSNYTETKRRVTVNPADVSANIPAAAATWDTKTYMKERVKNTFKWELANYYH